MSAIMAWRGGQVQLESSDMNLVLNMAIMAKGRFSPAAVEEAQYLFKKPRAEVQEEKKWGVEIPGQNKVKSTIVRHPAMFRQNQTDVCLRSQIGSANYLETHWRRIGTGAPQLN
jgi:hypothetical protein